MRHSKQQKWQLTLFCSLTIAYTSLLIGILRFSLDLAKIIFTNAALNTETLTKLIIYVCITSSAVSVVRFLKNVNKGFIFDRKNVQPLRWFGWTVTLTGLLLTLLHTLSDSSTQTYIFYLLTGVFINIWSEIFNLGIKLKEEQELTI